MEGTLQGMVVILFVGETPASSCQCTRPTRVGLCVLSPWDSTTRRKECSESKIDMQRAGFGMAAEILSSTRLGSLCFFLFVLIPVNMPSATKPGSSKCRDQKRAHRLTRVARPIRLHDEQPRLTVEPTMFMRQDLGYKAVMAKTGGFRCI